MKSRTTRQFKKHFKSLPITIKIQAVVAYRKWQTDPYQRGLFFKRVGKKMPVYSVRIGLDWRALGIIDGNQEKIIWFWIGSHAEYSKLIQKF